MSHGRIVKKGQQSFLVSSPKKTKLYTDFFVDDLAAHNNIIESLQKSAAISQNNAFRLLRYYKKFYQFTPEEVKHYAYLGNLTQDINYDDGLYKKKKKSKKLNKKKKTKKN